LSHQVNSLKVQEEDLEMNINPEGFAQIAKAVNALAELKIAIPADAVVETAPNKSANQASSPYTKEQLVQMGNPNYVTENGWITWE
jgi:hypothetical protein